MKQLSEDFLRDRYLLQLQTPYEIAKDLQVDHKTVRAYLRKYEIPLRSASEYNYLARKSHESPGEELLRSPLSVAAHVAYLCEGWHTEKTDMLSFCNQDPALISLFCRCLEEVYCYRKIRLVISFDPDRTSPTIVETFVGGMPDYHTLLQKDRSRKNPICIVKAGGKNLAREYIGNAYRLLETIGQVRCTPQADAIPSPRSPSLRPVSP